MKDEYNSEFCQSGLYAICTTLSRTSSRLKEVTHTRRLKEVTPPVKSRKATVGLMFITRELTRKTNFYTNHSPELYHDDGHEEEVTLYNLLLP